MECDGFRPCEILNEEFLKPLGRRQTRSRKATGVPPNPIKVILRMKEASRVTRRSGCAAGKGGKEYRGQQERAGLRRKTDEGKA
jgi:hypothetical protein